MGYAWGIGTAGAQTTTTTPRPHLALDYEYFDRVRRDPDLIDTRNAATAIPRVDWSPSAAIALRGSALFRIDASMDERTRVDLYETYITVDRSAWSLTAGRQFITWGRADSLRPTDVFNRHDLTDLVENREWPIDAARLDVFGGPHSIEVVWAPVFDPDIYSTRSDNPWTGLPLTLDVPGVGTLPASYRRDTSQEPPRTLGSGQAGVRYTGTARGWDFAGMYYWGYDRVPTAVTSSAVVDPTAGEVAVTLVPVHNRIHVGGGDLATAFGAWGVRAEVAYTATSAVGPGEAGRNPSFVRLTTGIDRTVSRLPAGDSLLIIVQYALDTTRPQPGPVEAQVVNPLLHPYRHGAIIRTDWRFREIRRLSLKAYVNLERGDYVLQPEWSWQPRDALTWTVGADLLGGPADAFFGRFASNDRFRVRLAYDF